ncbi:membrane frizzled-related protein-like [Dreissena polymorpha]|uniref:CUB domain-containing protein n=1 Tax=Dreissena polymorpha TaxID=45954 RepID=A0A9D4M9X6_DREPO|nr:membrane frizzled-related protein-like [Dreissena polymorpha]KAH3873470.1 hypothetical protein DPMN_036705 [Dreissena polymorpha]
MFVFALYGLLAVSGALPADRVDRAVECGSQLFLTTNFGQISSHGGFNNSHNYGKNMNCIWRVQAPEGQNVELVAKDFDVEADPSCGYDYVELFDGDSVNAPSLGKFCGSVFKPISSTQRYLTLIFVTDDNQQQTGFVFFYNFTTEVIHSCLDNQFACTNGRCISTTYKCDGDDDCLDDSDEQNCPAGGGSGTNGGSGACAADEFTCPDDSCIDRDWLCDGDDDCGDGADEKVTTCRTHSPVQAACGNTDLTGTAGTIKSPNYPSNYPNDVLCIYHIIADASTTSIHFKFDNSFDVEDDDTCQYDYIKITTDDANANKHGPFCGTTAPTPFNVPGNQAFVMFKADGSTVSKGFRVDWVAHGN